MARKVAARVHSLRPVTKKTAKKAKSAAKKTLKKATNTKAAKAKTKPKTAELNWNVFPPESLVESTLGLCLACALNVLTRQLGLTPERARSEIRRYNPTLEELTTSSPSRPYLVWPVNECPYCHALSKWHASLRIVKIEGGKATDASRRALVKNIGASPNFIIIEEKSTERDALYSWLSKTGTSLDLDSPACLSKPRGTGCRGACRMRTGRKFCTTSATFAVPAGSRMGLRKKGTPGVPLKVATPVQLHFKLLSSC